MVESLIPVETGVIIYHCRNCGFQTTDPNIATNHNFEESKKRRYDSRWQNQIEVLASRDGTAPCPLCNHNTPDLKKHLTKQDSPDRLVDTIFLLQNQNARLIGVTRSLQAHLRALTKGRLQVRRSKQHSTSDASSLNDEDLEDDPC